MFKTFKLYWIEVDSKKEHCKDQVKIMVCVMYLVAVKSIWIPLFTQTHFKFYSLSDSLIKSYMH